MFLSCSEILGSPVRFTLHNYVLLFRAVVIATVSVKPRGVSRVCFSQRDAEIPSSRFVTANRSAPRGRPPRRETGSSNSPSVAVHLSGSAPSYVEQDSS